SRKPQSAPVRHKVVASAFAVTTSGATTVAADAVKTVCPLRPSDRCAPRAYVPLVAIAAFRRLIVEIGSALSYQLSGSAIAMSEYRPLTTMSPPILSRKPSIAELIWRTAFAAWSIMYALPNASTFRGVFGPGGRMEKRPSVRRSQYAFPARNTLLTYTSLP